MNVPSAASLARKSTQRRWRAIALGVLCCVLPAVFAVRASSDETPSEFRSPTFPRETGDDDSEQTRQKESFRQWEVFLNNIEPGQGRDAIEKLLTGNYRDKCTLTLGGSGAQMDVYLLDDFHELHFHFDVIKGLVSQSIHKKTLWLRYPNGHVARIKEARQPSPHEIKPQGGTP